MKLGYQQATIGFCVDLTSPHSEIIPVANLLVGKAEGRTTSPLPIDYLPSRSPPSISPEKSAACLT